MEHVTAQVKKIAERIRLAEEKRERLAQILREPARPLKQSIVPDPLEKIRIAAVDGGLVKKALHGTDCLLVRAVGVCFDYLSGRSVGVQYIPSRHPTPRAESLEAASEIEWNHFASIQRLLEEVSVALKTVQEAHPNILLIDGMIMPHYLDRPPQDSPLYVQYDNLLRLYRSLFEECEKNNTTIVGVIKDSRHTLFCEHLMQTVSDETAYALRSAHDSQILSALLVRGEMTVPLPMPHREDGIPPVQSFYLKTVEHDRPLKIDCLVTSNPHIIAPIILALSSHNSRYGMPIPLVEADALVRLSDQDIDAFTLQVQGEVRSPNGFFLRRDQKPF